MNAIFSVYPLILVNYSTMYLIKTPEWLKKLYKNYIWDIPATSPKLYLTFDDGPNPMATPFVLKQLEQFHAKATFFCIGKNVAKEPGIFKDTLYQGHAIGNHTHNHLNGWKTSDYEYLKNVMIAAEYIDSDLFRPPYGRITRFQARALTEPRPQRKGFQIVMWDVLSGDFDTKTRPETCLLNVAKKAVAGSIVVFHDSEKAFANLSYVLPRLLQFLSEKGFQFDPITSDLVIRHK